MSDRRCPNCGGLVSPEAQWCGQCLTRLDDPAPATAAEAGPAGELANVPVTERPQPTSDATSAESTSGGEGVRLAGEAIVWTCPTCGTENPLDERTCGTCGTAFGQLFERGASGRSVPAGRGVAMSLLFPGLGHVLIGLTAQGIARATLFAYAVATVVAILIMRSGSGIGPFLPLLGISLLAAAAVYVLSAVDAGREVRGEPPVLTPRMLLYGTTLLILLTITVLVITGLRAANA